MTALFTTFGIDWHLLIAQTVNFVLLVVALTWFLYKPVLKMVRERERVIAQGIADAEASTEKLSRAGTEAQQLLSAAEHEAEDIVKRARSSAQADKTRMLTEAETQAVRIARDAEDRAHEEAARSLRESEGEIARIATLAAEKILRTNHD